MLSVSDVTISFGDVKIFGPTSFNIEKGEFIGLVGKNGSGKSTLSYLLTGIIPDVMAAEVTGSVDTKVRPSLLLQNPNAQFLSLSVKEELNGIDYTGFDIDHLIDRNVFELSEGEKQKINLIVNLNKSDFIIMDEPLELLDPYEADRFMETIRSQKGKTVLWLDKNDRYLKKADRVIHLNDPKKSLPKRRKKSQGNILIDVKDMIFVNDLKIAVEISLRKGEVVALIGRNGSGKSTILRWLSGFSHPRYVSGIDIGFMVQNPSHTLYKETVFEELPDKDMLKEISLLKLKDHDPAKLSKGQQKILTLGICAEKNPELFLLDEPTTWLDDINRASVFYFMNRTDAGFLIATHDPELVKFADRILILEDNKVSECSPTRAKQFFHPSLSG